MPRISEHFPPIYVLKPGDHQAGVDGESINLGKAGHRLRFLVAFAALTGDAVLTVNSGATDGTKTTAETFRYRLAGAAQAAASADQFGDWATSAGLTLTAATYQNKLLVVEIDNAALTEGQPWVTFSFSAAADALNAAVVADYAPRYAANDPPTAI